MPWTPKQMKLFRAAAHNPAVAESSGIKQSDASRMSKEGIKTPSSTKAKINKQNTRHGKMDLPVASLNKFTGMKGGGMAKKGKRFEEGGDVEYEDYVPGKYTQSVTQGDEEIYRRPSVEYKEEVSKAATSKVTPKPPVKSTPTAVDEGKSGSSGFAETRGRKAWSPSNPDTPRSAYDADEVGAVTGRASSKYKSKLSDKEKEDNAERMGWLAAGALPGGAAIKGAQLARKSFPAAKKAAQEARMKKAAADYNKGRTPEAQAAWKKENPKDRNAHLFAKGGLMKDSKAMVKKEVAFFKKKGAPASMIKHEEKEAKAMKFAKGGGIESRGKTKGKMIRMAAGGIVRFASGGAVSSRADGIAQRGKTNCKIR